jgi:hypothetical protein
MTTKLLSEFEYQKCDKYRFVLARDVTVYFSKFNFGYHDLRDGNGKVWCEMRGRHVTIKAGYAWDGASPKFRLFGIWLGTPDFASTRLGTLFHDLFYQFLHLPCIRESELTRIKADALFGDIMRDQGFNAHWLYSGAVMVAGGAHRAITGGKRSGYCTLHETQKNNHSRQKVDDQTTTATSQKAL